MTQELPPLVIAGAALSFQGYDQGFGGNAARSTFPGTGSLLTFLQSVALYVMTASSCRCGGSEQLKHWRVRGEFISAASLAVLLLSLRWFMERRALRYSHYTIGTILGRDPDFSGAGSRTNFETARGKGAEGADLYT